jgi:hypothetical protein
MLRRRTCLSFFAMLLTVLGCVIGPAAPPQPRVTLSPLFSGRVYDRLGVYVENRSGPGLEAGSIRAVEDEFMRVIIEKGYTLAARSDMEQVHRELRLQASGITEQAVARGAPV